MMVFRAIVLLVLLASCSSPPSRPFHAILGSTYGWDVTDRNVKVLVDAEIDKLRVRHVRINDTNCISGVADHLEISGAIGPDSTAAIERLIPKLHKCHKKAGGLTANAVFLSSGGGRLIDGFKLGYLFKNNEMETIINGGQVCASSCAIAFLGGKYRTMNSNAKLLFHAPYLSNGIALDCSDRGQLSELKAYYRSTLGEKEGDYLFDRTMSYCSSIDGWTLNADAAKLFGVTTIRKDGLKHDQ